MTLRLIVGQAVTVVAFWLAGRRLLMFHLHARAGRPVRAPAADTSTPVTASHPEGNQP